MNCISGFAGFQVSDISERVMRQLISLIFLSTAKNES